MNMGLMDYRYTITLQRNQLDHGGTIFTYHHIDCKQSQSWAVKLHRTNTSSPKLIAPGVTHYEFEVQLQPDLPPTIEGKRGWFHYRFKAFMQRDFPFRNMAVKQLVWVYSSSLRAGQHELAQEADLARIYKQVVWSDILPVTCSLPSTSVLYQGQVVPLTVRIDPFLENSIHKGQELIVMSALVKLKQYTTLRDPSKLGNTQKEKKEVIVLPVMEGWPVTSQGFERIVNIELPGARKLAASIDSVPVTKTHTLKLIMMIRTPLIGEKEAKELRVEMGVTITSPRPEHIKGIAPEYSSLPPPYLIDSEDGDEDNDDDVMPPDYRRSSTSQSEFQSDAKTSSGL
ncbi:hypothetical protein BGX24_011141 [Mortierella sp. AD032]|nr:hypothetical protein BGX24_011141 [Mortierella sp. AD032]